jgi:excisionase family DNA binding protein
MAALRPIDLAKRWQCSERHIRKMIESGRLRAFRLGEKLVRIPLEAVEELENAPYPIGPDEPSAAEVAAEQKKRIDNAANLARLSVKASRLKR